MRVWCGSLIFGVVFCLVLSVHGPAYGFDFQNEKPYPDKTLLRDDELVLLPWLADNQAMTAFVFSPAAKSLDMGQPAESSSQDFSNSEPNVVPARLHKEDEQIVFAVSYTSAGAIRVYSLDPGNANWSHVDTYHGLLKSPDMGKAVKLVGLAATDLTDDQLDELVLAYTAQDGSLGISILTSNGGGGLAQMPLSLHDATEGTVPSADGGFPQVNLQTADFDGDGRDEAVLSYYAAHGSHGDVCFHVVGLEFGEYDAAGNSIECRFVSSFDASPAFRKSTNVLDAAAADLNGDGDAELVLSGMNLHFSVIDVDEKMQFSMPHDGYHETKQHEGRVDVQSGDIDFDGADEIAVMTHQTVRLYKMTSDLKDVAVREDMPTMFPGQGPGVVQAMGIALGNFDGEKDPNLELAMAMPGLSEVPPWYLMDIVDLDTGLKPSGHTVSQHMWGSFLRLFSGLACDIDNDSLVLGTPTHYVRDDNHDFTLVMGEPPKHLDYMTDMEGETRLVNVSNFSEEAPSTKSVMASFFHKEGETTEVTHKSSTDFNVGVQVESETDTDFHEAEVEEKASLKLKASMSSERFHERWTDDNAEDSTSYDVWAREDDELIYRTRRVHIYVYPVLGHAHTSTQDGQEGRAYYTLVIPEEQSSLYLVQGTQCEWYQPVHENSNILSYPWRLDLLDAADESLFQNSELILTMGGNEMNRDVEWSSTHVDGDKLKTSLKLGGSLEFSSSTKISLFGDSVKEKLKVKTHIDNTWTDLDTSETTTTKSQGISIHAPPIESGYAYQMQPLFYKNNKTGAFQLSHLAMAGSATTSLASGRDFWDPNYIYEPDLALNLPHRWKAVEKDGEQDWELAAKNRNFRKARGIWLYNDKEELAGLNMTVGEQYTLRARVYNYSFKRSENQFDVLFEYQESDDGLTWSETRKTVGRDRLALIPGFGETDDEGKPRANWVFAQVDFTPPADAKRFLRFWATVDPDNAVDEREAHGLGEEFDNNQGWFGQEFGVVADDELAGLLLQQPENGASLSARLDVIGAPVIGEEVEVQLTIDEVTAYMEHVQVAFFDEPAEGAAEEGRARRAFDIEIAPHLLPGRDTIVNVPYTVAGPEGERTISAVIHYNDPEEGARTTEASTRIDVDDDEGSTGCTLGGRGMGFSALGLLALGALALCRRGGRRGGRSV